MVEGASKRAGKAGGWLGGWLAGWLAEVGGLAEVGRVSCSSVFSTRNLSIYLSRHAGLRSPILLRHREELGARERPQPGLSDRCNAAKYCDGALRAANLLEIRVADEDAHEEWRLSSGEDEILVESFRSQC